MYIKNNLKGTKGFLTVYESAVRWKYMRNQKEVERRVKALTFWKQYGLQAAIDAFDVSRRTLFRWKQSLEKEQGKLSALDPKSTVPKNKRKRIYSPGYLENVITLRKEHPRIGKKKIAVILGVSESYAGRTLTDLKERGLLPKHQKLSFHARTGRLHVRTVTKKKRIRRTTKQGIEIDTVVRFVNGVKRYIYTAIDVERRFGFAGAYTSHSSASASDFLDKLILVAPFPITEIQTDNGSEFAKFFEKACSDRGITQYHTYPRCPKMNAHIERFNRTISDDFISQNRLLLATDLHGFNEKMIDWLLWYNSERPHQSLGMLSPLQFMCEGLLEEECQKWWTSTST